MQRRSVLTCVGMIAIGAARTEPAAAATSGQAKFRRVRPSDPAWPSAAAWEVLNRSVGGNLIKVQPLLAACVNQGRPECQDMLEAVKNPYYVGDQPAGTQTAGWVDAWMSAPSVYAVAARSTEDVVAAVNFARGNRLRLVVKGGGHSYQGTSELGQFAADLDARDEQHRAA